MRKAKGRSWVARRMVVEPTNCWESNKQALVPEVLLGRILGASRGGLLGATWVPSGQPKCEILHTFYTRFRFGAQTQLQCEQRGGGFKYQRKAAPALGKLPLYEATTTSNLGFVALCACIMFARQGCV